MKAVLESECRQTRRAQASVKAMESHPCGGELSRIATGAVANFAGKVLGGALQFLYTVIIVRLLGAESFGVFMLGLTVISLAGVLGRLGLEMGLVKFVAAYHGVSDKPRLKGVIIQSIKYSLIASTAAGILLFISAEPLIARLFNKPQLGGVIRCLAPSLPFLSLMIVALGATQGFQIMKYTAYAQNLFWPATNTMLALLFFSFGLELYGVAAAHAISVVLAALLAVYFLGKCLPDMKQTEVVRETKRLFTFSAPLLALALVHFLLLWTDTLMLGFFRTPDEVGIYNASMRTALLIGLILTSFNAIFAPVISDLHNKQENQKVSRLFKSVTRWVLGVSLPAFLLMAFLSKDIMGIFGQEFNAGRVPLVILAFSQLVNAAAGSVAMLLAMSGRERLVLKYTLLSTFLNLILNYALIPRYGIVGAAIATAASVIILNVVMLGVVWALYRIHPYTSQYYKGFFAAVASYAFLFLLGHILPEIEGLPRILLFSPLFFALCSLFMLGLGFDADDRLLFNTLWKRFVGRAPARDSHGG